MNPNDQAVLEGKEHLKINCIPNYSRIHKIIAKEFGKASKCEQCKVPGKSKYEWSNISETYQLVRSDWEELCPSCHKKKDLKDTTRMRISLSKLGKSAHNRINVVQRTLSGEFVARYESCYHAAKKTGIDSKAIWNQAKGYTKSSGGFLWEQIKG